jgi:hypothetical protein
MVRWKTKLTQFVGTWRMWVLVVALASAGAGVVAGGGLHVNANVANQPIRAEVGMQTPGGAPGADVGLEKAHREAFAHPPGDPGQDYDCPQADRVTSKLTTTVSANGSLVIASTLHLTATGVTPPHPPINLNIALQRPDGAGYFATCFIATNAALKSISWADGKLDADIDLEWHDNPHDFIGYTNQVVKAALSGNHAILTLDICQPHPEWAYGLRTICKVGATTTVVVRVARPLDNYFSRPFPTSQAQNGDYFDSTWQFEGPMPRLTVKVSTPNIVSLSTRLYWDRGHTFAVPGVGLASVDLYYLADAFAIWIALFGTALILRGKQSSPGLLTYSARLALILGAAALLGLELRQLGSLDERYSNGVVVVITWAALAAAVASKRTILATAALFIAALAPLLWLAFAPPGPQASDLLLVWSSIGLMELVIWAAWALWCQIRCLFALADLAQDAPAWYGMYRKLIDCLMIVAFMIGIGFPIGEILYGANPDWINRLASDLIWSTGLMFRAPLAWVSLLLAISFMAQYLTSHPRRPLAPRKRGGWAKVRWTRVGNRAVGALIAMILCLSAPWTNRFAIDFLPVWLLQFGGLWVAFALLPDRAGVVSPARRRRARTAQLLKAAVGATSADELTQGPGAVPSGEPGNDSAPRSVQTQDAEAVSRLLIVGSQRGRLANAKSAAQIASVIAIVPVVYLMSTTLTQLGGRLSTNTGGLIVALLAVVEFARWVVSGFVFGYLYPKLPGRIGPVKALSFGAIWAFSCIGPLVVAQNTASNLTHEVIYRIAQFALFSIVLAIVIDIDTVRSAGGSWRDLRKVYDLQNYGEVAAAVVPAALLVLALGQQIIAGSGVQVANTLLSGITSVLKGPL